MGEAHFESNTMKFKYAPKISILMPTYNSEENWLHSSIQSVLSQTYSNWELCIADDYSTNENVRKVLEKYKELDDRIKVIFLESNLGISGATNKAFDLTNGDFIGLLDHDDELDVTCLSEVVKLLNEDPTIDFIYTDEDKISSDGRYVEPYFKSDFSPDLLYSMNYINHFSLFRKETIKKVGGWRTKFDGSQDYDLILRVVEKTDRIAHIKKILYHWRKVPGSAAEKINAKEYALISGKKAIEDSLKRRNIAGSVDMILSGRYRVNYEILNDPLVSIIIPTKDKVNLLKKCIESIYEKSSYNNFEVIVLNNNSMERETFLYFKEIQKKYNVIILDANIQFNYSRLNNLGVKHSKGEYLLFLNNDTEIISSNWIEELLGQAQQSHVGAVGAKLIYHNNTIQHAGVLIGKSIAWHAFYGYPLDSNNDLLSIVRNCSAVTGACLMVSRKIFDEVEGFDENLDVIYNDVDICLKIYKLGYFNVWNPNAVLYHHESATRGKSHPKKNSEYFCGKWFSVLNQGDPFDTVERMDKVKINHALQNNTKDTKREILIWGAGSSGYRIYSTISELNYQVNGFVDSDKNKWNKLLFNVPILSPEKLLSADTKPYVVVASMYSDEIKAELIKMGFTQEKDFWVDN